MALGISMSVVKNKMQITVIPAPFRRERQRIVGKTVSVLSAGDPLRKRAVSIIELVDWCHYEVGYNSEVDALGLYAIILDELVRFAGFEWVELSHEGLSFPAVRHMKNGFIVSCLDNVTNLINESPRSEATFSRVFFSRLIELYKYTPICGPGWHPMLDIVEYGRTDLDLGDEVLRLARLDSLTYDEVVEEVYKAGFQVWVQQGRVEDISGNQ